jgi:threonine synthase
MDVGAPSNFERMAAHFSWDEMKRIIRGVSVSDAETREAIKAVYRDCGYFLDPHSAVGWNAADRLIKQGLLHGPLAILSTAHPAKFAETVEPITTAVPVPPSLARAMDRKIESRTIPAEESAFLEVL